jgi:alpha-glucosidase
MMREWWRDAVIYQVYPRSFQDTDGDGIGDLPGVTQRLAHVAGLGADAVWLSPFFTSPDRDMGYDVSDYTGVNPIFGTLEDFDRLVARAHGLGLRVIIDQVLSHSSDRHPWFSESRSSRDNPKADWYVWADPRPDGSPPNNWLSVFGGSAWQFDPRRRQYYLHNFLTEQPDINFHCEAAVEAILGTMQFWLERGVDGFRLDTVNFYVHDRRLRNNPRSGWTQFPGNPYEAQDHVRQKTQPENLDVLRRMRALCDRHGGAMMVGEVGEMGRRQVEIMGDYTRGDDLLHMAYSFALLSDDQSAGHVRRVVETFLEVAPDGWPCWSFSNHDVRRHVSRWTRPGGDSDAVARQAIALLISFPGALNLYQGEELGQTETEISFEELRDTASIAFWPEYKGRDGCRTPMVWDGADAQGGFSTGVPWLPVKAPQLARALSLQEGREGSVVEAYRAALAFRRAAAPLRLGQTRFADLPEPVLGVVRSLPGEVLTGVFNLSDVPQVVHLGAGARLTGPCHATLAGQVLGLPARGYAFLAAAGAVGLSMG